MTISTDEADQSRPVDKQPEAAIDHDWMLSPRFLCLLSAYGADLDMKTSTSQSVDKLVSRQEPQLDAQLFGGHPDNQRAAENTGELDRLCGRIY